MAPDLLLHSPPLSRRSSSTFSPSNASLNLYSRSNAHQQVSDKDFHLCFADSPHPELDLPLSPAHAFPQTPNTPHHPSFFAVMHARPTRMTKIRVEDSPSASSVTSDSSSSGSGDSSSDPFDTSSSSDSPSSSSPSSFSCGSSSSSSSPSLASSTSADDDKFSPSPDPSERPSPTDLLPEFVLGGALATEFGLAQSPVDVPGWDAFPMSPHSPPELHHLRSGTIPFVTRDAAHASHVRPAHLSRNSTLAPPTSSN